MFYECKAKGLMRQSLEKKIDVIHEWYGDSPKIQPPHIQDLLSPSYANF